MTQILSHKDRHLLVSILGMLGSSQDGERAAAAQKATELLTRLHLTWDELIIVSQLSGSGFRNDDNPYKKHKITPMVYPNFDITS